MPETTWVNSQITDAVTQSNVKVLGDVPAESIGMLYQMAAQATGLSMQNLVSNQQHNNTIDSAAVTGAISLLYTMDVASEGKSVSEILSGNSVAETMASLKGAMAPMSAGGPERPGFNG